MAIKTVLFPACTLELSADIPTNVMGFPIQLYKNILRCVIRISYNKTKTHLESLNMPY